MRVQAAASQAEALVSGVPVRKSAEPGPNRGVDVEVAAKLAES